MKRYLTYNLVTLLIFTFSDCKKDHGSNVDNAYGLPNSTQTGSMVFACRINGHNEIDESDLFSQKNGRITKDSTTFFASFGNADYFVLLTFLVYGNTMIQKAYDLSNSVETKFLFATDSTCVGISSNVFSANTASGTIIFTKLDSTRKIISGNFECKVAVPGCDTLNFTDGRFDIGY